MSEDPSLLVKIAALNAKKRDWSAALDSLERAAATATPELQPKIRELAHSLATTADLPRALLKRAQVLENAFSTPAVVSRETSKSPPPPATPTPTTPVVSTQELVAARELIVTPDLVRALRQALGAAPPTESDPALTLPVERIVSRLLACDLDLGPVLDLTLDLALEAVGAARGFIVLRDERGHFALSRSRGLTKNDFGAELSTSILAEAERTGQPVFLGDAATDPEFGTRESVKDLGLRSVACVPILEPASIAPSARASIAPSARASMHQLLGAVYLDDARVADRFNERARALLVAIAAAIAPALRNARRFEAQRAALVKARQPRPESEPVASGKLVGHSRAIRGVVALLAKLAPEEVPVLIEGESGTGKELAARVLHDLSPRAASPFVAENLGALPETLVESELFGVVQGAFTGADRDRDGLFVRAGAGTLFLDEIGELPLAAQAKLLRVLQEREVRPIGGDRTVRIRARIVAATNRDLAAEVKAGTFREDLLYRLRVVAVRMPPLRERAEDIAEIAEHILERISATRGEPCTPLSRAALARLASRPWPGNVRELENALWCVALAGESALEPAPPPPSEVLGVLGQLLAPAGLTVPLEEARVAFDRAYLAAALARHDGNIAAAGRALSITRPALSKLLKKLGVDKPS